MADVEYPMAVKRVSEEDGGGYVALAVDLKGCMGDGETPEEAVANLREAIIEWLDEARRLNREIPAPGVALARAREEREEMIEIIKKQDEVLSSQSQILSKLIGELSGLREKVEALSSQGDFVVPIWGCADAKTDLINAVSPTDPCVTH